MIVVRAPYRVSFFGGGTDYPAWFERHGGAVISATLDRYCYVVLRRARFLDHRYLVSYRKLELVDTVDEIEHAAVRGCLQYLPVDSEPGGVEITHAGDMPARAGLGSSSAFTVAMLRALYALRGEHVAPTELARAAIHVEQRILRETVGVQDQIACAVGDLRHIIIDHCGGFTAEPLTISDDVRTALSQRLLLFYTGVQRHASEIAAAQVANFDRREAELTAIAALVPKAAVALSAGRLDDFGAMLHESWEFKKALSEKISNEAIDDAYTRARQSGALGGKVLGAGGGGFLLLYVPSPWQDVVRGALTDLVEMPFRLGREGARVLVYEP
jgi:D-glycero-alpha-D-manno-heptose-7-phosphate kinase